MPNCKNLLLINDNLKQNSWKKITTNQIEWCDVTIIQHEIIITNHLYKPTKKQQ
jgi:hypothetical protein